jgi:hypothetical protein
MGKVLFRGYNQVPRLDVSMDVAILMDARNSV